MRATIALLFLLAVTGPVFGADLISNGSFETYSGSPTAWDSWTATRGGDSTIEAATDAGNYKIGNAAVVITTGSTTGYASTYVKPTTDITVTPGNTYTVSFWVKTTGTSQGKIYIRDMRNNGYLTGFNAQQTGQRLNWTRWSANFTAPTGPIPCDSVSPRLYAGGTTGNVVYYDDFQLMDYVAPPSGATYVDCDSGVDTAAGTIGAPWKTVEKLAVTTFAAGDTIYLKKGCTWTNEKIVANASGGGEATRITYTSYGASGAAPKVHHDYETAFTITSQNYITIDGIDFESNTSSRTSSVRLVTIDGTSDNVTVKNSDIGYSGNVGIKCGPTTTNILYDTITAHDNRSTGIYSAGNTVTIQNCTSTRAGQVAGDTGDRGGIGIQGQNTIVQYNEVYDNGPADQVLCDAEIAMATDTTDGYSHATYPPNNNIVRYNYVHDCKGNCMTFYSADNAQVYGNIFSGFGSAGSNGFGVQIGGAIFGPNNLKVFNNTFVGGLTGASYSGGVGVKHNAVDPAHPELGFETPTGIEIRNNIFYDLVCPAILVDSHADTTSGVSLSNNDYYRASGLTGYWNYKGTLKNSLQLWKDAIVGWTEDEHNSLTDAPGFIVGSGSDWRLSASSPLVNQGDNTIVTGIASMTDYQGAPRTNAGGTVTAYGGVVDIGAYEVFGLTEVTPVTTPTTDITPVYTFNTPAAGVITYGGSCSGDTSTAVAGNNTVNLSVSATPATHSDCTITVAGGAALSITPFTITSGTVSVTAPANNTALVGTKTVSATCSITGDTVAGVTFKYRGDAIAAEDTSSPYSISWDTTTLPNSSGSITAVCRGAGGGQTISSPINVTIANPEGTGPTRLVGPGGVPYTIMGRTVSAGSAVPEVLWQGTSTSWQGSGVTW